MKKTVLTFFLLGALLLPVAVYAHCEIPCGIYDDQMRVKMIHEHITTVEKSRDMIERLSADSPVDYNQLIRWVDNKEAHAVKIQETVFQYFMCQRIKPSAEGDKQAEAKYLHELRLLHELAVEAMKSKQSVDPVHIKRMTELTDAFAASYFGE